MAAKLERPPGDAKQAEAAGADKAQQRAMTVRLSAAAHKQLRLLSVEEDTTALALIVEGLNAVFKARGLPTISG